MRHRLEYLNHRAVFVVGAPGVGKTTVVRALLEPHESITRFLVEKPKWTVCKDIVAAGHYTGGTFDGADTVPYGGVEEALKFWDQEFKTTKRVTILDGDRFSHDKVVQWFQKRACPIVVVYFTAADKVLAKRRAKRGSNQNATWLKGRVTKSRNFYDAAREKADGLKMTVFAVDLSGRSDAIIRELKKYLDL